MGVVKTYLSYYSQTVCELYTFELLEKICNFWVKSPPNFGKLSVAVRKRSKKWRNQIYGIFPNLFIKTLSIKKLVKREFKSIFRSETTK